MVVIIDYGMGNLGSIRNMLKKVGTQAVVSSDAEEIGAADGIILPGVGAFDAGMRRLAELDLISELNRQVLDHRAPILGICLGMQLFTNRSEEGRLPGLGWIDADTIRFRNGAQPEFRVPHMGWNDIRPTKEHFLFADLITPRFYFVHSYHVQCRRSDDILATCDYGGDFAASVGRDNVMGTQFHPEKSHKFGWTLLRNFVKRVDHVQSQSDALFAA